VRDGGGAGHGFQFPADRSPPRFADGGAGFERTAAFIRHRFGHSNGEAADAVFAPRSFVMSASSRRANSRTTRSGGARTTERPCLRCQDRFPSAWAGERVCPRCKSTSAWREGMPEMSSRVSDGRR
jgi:hypothetical protein